MANHAKEREKEKLAPRITVRKSAFLLTIRIIIIELVYITLLVIGRVSFSYLDLTDASLAALFDINNILFILLASLKTLFIILVVLRWVSSYYEIGPEGITHVSGLFADRRRTFYFRDVGEITMRKTIFGRIFNYGTVRLYNSILHQYFYLLNVHKPEKYLKIVKTYHKSLPHQNQVIYKKS